MERGARSHGKGLGARMRAARVNRDLGLRALAQQVGMSASSLSEFEHGKSMPGASRLEALSQVLEVPLDPPVTEPPEPWFEHWRTFDPVQLNPVTQAALEIFTELGYHGSTMRMIADRCGMSVAGVYHYAESKQELLSLLLGRGIAEIEARCAAAEAEGATPAERLTNLAECIVLFHLFRRPWAVLSATELRSLNEVEKELLKESRRRIRDMVLSAVIDYRGDGEVDVPVETTAVALTTMCVAIADWYDPSKYPAPRDIARQYAALGLAMAAGAPLAT